MFFHCFFNKARWSKARLIRLEIDHGCRPFLRVSVHFVKNIKLFHIESLPLGVEEISRNYFSNSREAIINGPVPLGSLERMISFT